MDPDGSERRPAHRSPGSTATRGTRPTDADRLRSTVPGSEGVYVMSAVDGKRHAPRDRPARGVTTAYAPRFSPDGPRSSSRACSTNISGALYVVGLRRVRPATVSPRRHAVARRRRRGRRDGAGSRSMRARAGSRSRASGLSVPTGRTLTTPHGRRRRRGRTRRHGFSAPAWSPGRIADPDAPRAALRRRLGRHAARPRSARTVRDLRIRQRREPRRRHQARLARRAPAERDALRSTKSGTIPAAALAIDFGRSHSRPRRRRRGEMQLDLVERARRAITTPSPRWPAPRSTGSMAPPG